MLVQEELFTTIPSKGLSARKAKRLEEAMRVLQLRPDAVKSADEAIELYEKVLADLLDKADAVAVDLAQEFGSVCAMDVVQTMHGRGMLTDVEWRMNRRWTGALFSGKRREKWTKAGEVRISDCSRNTHMSSRTRWKLRGEKTATGDQPTRTELQIALRDLRFVCRYQEGRSRALDLLVAWVENVSAY